MNLQQKEAYNKHLNKVLAEIKRREVARLFDEMFSEKVPYGIVVKPAYRELIGQIREANLMRKLALRPGFFLEQWMRGTKPPESIKPKIIAPRIDARGKIEIVVKRLECTIRHAYHPL